MNLSKNKKKIIIFDTYLEDYKDFTLESIDKMRSSDCLIVSKNIKKQTFEFCKENSKKIISEEILSKNKSKLWNEILKLFGSYKIITHLSFHNNLFNESTEEEKFFKKNQIETERLLNVLSFVNILNTSKHFLTNRKKNSSVLFINKLKIAELKKTLESRGSGKIIVRISSKEEFSSFLKEFKKEIFTQRKYRFNLILKNKTLYINSEFIRKFRNFKFQNNFNSLLIEENVEI